MEPLGLLVARSQVSDDVRRTARPAEPEGRPRSWRQRASRRIIQWRVSWSRRPSSATISKAGVQ